MKNGSCYVTVAGSVVLNKLEDPDTGEIHKHSLSITESRHLRCSSYNDRKKFVPDCRKLSPKKFK